MVGKFMLMKTKWYPRPHDDSMSFAFGLESAIVNQTTIVPIVMYDEGLGTPSAYEANPEHASFVEAGEPNCFPDSRVNLINAVVQLNLNKNAGAGGDNLDAVKMAFMPIFGAFLEDYRAIDELSSLETQDIIEMDTTDSTDRQAYPLWNNVKMKTKYGTAAYLPANVPNLTTNQGIEAVAFSSEAYYDMLHYQTNSGKLKTIQGGLKWITLTRQRPFINIPIRLRSSTKFMNPFTFFGILLHCPSASTDEQYQSASETTDLSHIWCTVKYRYSEWNQDFNFKKV